MLADSTLLLILAYLALVSLGFVIWRCQTVLLGFTIYSFINIAAASLSAFLFSNAAGLPQDGLTQAHFQVLQYTSWGLIAFSCGILLAWRPLWIRKSLRQSGVLPQQLWSLSWFNAQTASVLMVVAILSHLLAPVAMATPLRSIWAIYLDVLRFGMLIALAYSCSVRQYRLFWICCTMFLPLVIVQAVLTGHIQSGGTFLIQLLLVACFWNRSFSPRMVAVFACGMAIIMTLAMGWLDSRGLIREGHLEGLSTYDKATTFVRNFRYSAPWEVDAEQVHKALLDRIDMSDTLASQVNYQPLSEPFAYGETIYTGLLAALVPRFIWPEKPQVLGGSKFVTRFSGETYAEGTSVGVPYQFEFYANGGVLGVIIGLFVLGWLTARLELSLFDYRHSFAKTIALLGVVHLIANGAQTIVALLVMLLIAYFSLYGLARILYKMRFKSWKLIALLVREHHRLPARPQNAWPTLPNNR